jgi:hypothetical protein
VERTELWPNADPYKNSKTLLVRLIYMNPELYSERYMRTLESRYRLQWIEQKMTVMAQTLSIRMNGKGSG